MFNKSRISRHLFAVSLALLSLSTAILAQRNELRSDLGRSFSEFKLAAVAADRLRSDGTVTIESEAGAQRLVLYPRDLRSRRYRAIDTSHEGDRTLPYFAADTYMGKLAGDESSSVRLTVRGSTVEGFFVKDGERFLIESASRYSEKASAGDVVIYRPGDHLDADGYTCLSDFEARLEKGKEVALANVSRLNAPVVMELATEADNAWVNELGGATQANQEILSILNMVEGTFQAEMNISISVVFQHTWTAADPYDGTNATNLLNSFKNHWNTSYPTIAYPRDTAHLFSSRPSVASMGLAFLGTVCRSPSFAYGLSGRISWAPGKYLVTAHELGHNLKANHVDSTQSCGNTLMNPVLSGSTPMTFCPYSRNEMDTFVAANGSCLEPAAAESVTDYDFDGDSRSDIAVWRPSNGVWYVFRSQNNGLSTVPFGQQGDKPVAADYDGDGKADPAVYRDGSWFILRSSDGTYSGFQFGVSSDIPVPADFDGDGKTDSAVFRPAIGVWFIYRSSDAGVRAVQFGISGDTPLPGDYDGDGKADLNVFRGSSGVWYLLDSSGRFSSRQFGQPGDKPVRGDFDGDGKHDAAVFRPSNGTWYVSKSSNGGFFAAGFGVDGDVPTPGDFDGDGVTDLAVFRPSSGVWYTRRSSNGGVSATSFGIATDVPAPSSYLP